MGTMAFSAQYLQRPVPLAGNLIKGSWFRSMIKHRVLKKPIF